MADDAYLELQRETGGRRDANRRYRVLLDDTEIGKVSRGLIRCGAGGSSWRSFYDFSIGWNSYISLSQR